MGTKNAPAFLSNSPVLLEDLEKMNQWKKKERKEGENREEKERERERKKEGEEEREEERGAPRAGTVIIHVDVNISTKTGSRKISPGSHWGHAAGPWVITVA